MVLLMFLLGIFALIVLLSVWTLLFSLYKKKKSLMKKSLILLAIGLIGCILFGFIYAEKIPGFINKVNSSNKVLNNVDPNTLQK